MDAFSPTSISCMTDLMRACICTPQYILLLLSFDMIGMLDLCAAANSQRISLQMHRLHGLHNTSTVHTQLTQSTPVSAKAGAAACPGACRERRFLSQGKNSPIYLSAPSILHVHTGKMCATQGSTRWQTKTSANDTGIISYSYSYKLLANTMAMARHPMRQRLNQCWSLHSSEL